MIKWRITRVIDKIEDLFEQNSDTKIGTIRIKLKEIFSYKTEDFHLIYIYVYI